VGKDMSWFQTLQAQPWFSDVSTEFSQLAPDVPTYLWEGEILSEDSSLNPAQQNSGGAPYYGLFQEGVQFPTTVGLPATTVAQLQNPEYNAYYAALAMEKALRNMPPGASLEQQVQLLETAGWPGAVSSAETASRVANVNQVITAQGGTPAASSTAPNLGTIPGIIGSGNLAGVIPGIGALIQGKGWNAANQAAAAANSTAKANLDPLGLQSAVAQLGQNLLIGGIIIAGITGGFLLLSNSMQSSQGGGMPVPVPI
jgi:hypothetical protein